MRPEKQSIVQEYREHLRRAQFALLADPSGMNVAKSTELRSRLRDVGARMQVVKNRLLKIALRDAGVPAEVEKWLQGPNALIFGEGDIVAVSKELKRFIDENEGPALRGGYLGDRLLTAEEIEQIARLPSREELLGRTVGAIAAPLSGLVGCLNQMVGRLLYVLKAIEEKKQSGQ